MREYKFRGLSENTDEWVYGSLIQYFGNKIWVDSSEIWVHDDTNEAGLYFIVDPNTVGQYTGLKDKNGVEIYEGDITVYIDESGDKVLHSEMVVDWDYSILLALQESAQYGITHSVQVIGNIFQNKELLNN